MGGTTNCQNILGTPSCTAGVAYYQGQLVAKGDLSDTVQSLALYDYFYGAGLGPNVGLPAQTGANGYIGNYASSNYNALLITLHKRISNGLQFDINYTLSHSIDNVSEITNNYVTYTGNGAGSFATWAICALAGPVPTLTPGTSSLQPMFMICLLATAVPI